MSKTDLSSWSLWEKDDSEDGEPTMIGEIAYDDERGLYIVGTYHTGVGVVTERAFTTEGLAVDFRTEAGYEHDIDYEGEYA